MDKNPSANAGDTGSFPYLGRSQMPWSNWARVPQLPSLRSRARELQLLSQHTAAAEACAPQEKPLQRGAHARQLESSPCSLLTTTGEKPAQQWRPAQPQINTIIKKKEVWVVLKCTFISKKKREREREVIVRYTRILKKKERKKETAATYLMYSSGLTQMGSEEWWLVAAFYQIYHELKSTLFFWVG